MLFIWRFVCSHIVYFVSLWKIFNCSISFVDEEKKGLLFPHKSNQVIFTIHVQNISSSRINNCNSLWFCPQIPLPPKLEPIQARVASIHKTSRSTSPPPSRSGSTAPEKIQILPTHLQGRPAPPYRKYLPYHHLLLLPQILILLSANCAVYTPFHHEKCNTPKFLFKKSQMMTLPQIKSSAVGVISLFHWLYSINLQG